jgi:hypothetical protein
MDDSLPGVHAQAIALYNAYAEGDPERCAVHHLNIANQLEHGGGDPAIFLAHRLAGGAILFQADSPLLADALGELALSFARAAPRKPQLPATFEELCRLVESVDGVHFRALSEALGQDGGAGGDEAMHAVIGMARAMAG